MIYIFKHSVYYAQVKLEFNAEMLFPYIIIRMNSEYYENKRFKR